MFKFKNYPPSWIPLKYWVYKINRKFKVEYLVIPTLIAWYKKDSQI